MESSILKKNNLVDEFITHLIYSTDPCKSCTFATCLQSSTTTCSPSIRGIKITADLIYNKFNNTKNVIEQIERSKYLSQSLKDELLLRYILNG